MKIHHISLSVKDLDKSVKFYKDFFGFEEINRFTKEGWNGEAVILELNNMQIELFHFNDFVEKTDDLMKLNVIGLKHIGIEVDNVAEKYDELKSAGVDIDEPKKGTTCEKYCFLRDSDGVPIELYESKK